MFLTCYFSMFRPSLDYLLSVFNYDGQIFIFWVAYGINLIEIDFLIKKIEFLFLTIIRKQYFSFTCKLLPVWVSEIQPILIYTFYMGEYFMCNSRTDLFRGKMGQYVLYGSLQDTFLKILTKIASANFKRNFLSLGVTGKF